MVSCRPSGAGLRVIQELRMTLCPRSGALLLPQGCDMSGPAQNRPAPGRIIVLAGGTSAEREVSLSSGAAVHAALCERGLKAELVDPAITDLHQFAWSPGDIAFIAL